MRSAQRRAVSPRHKSSASQGNYTQKLIPCVVFAGFCAFVWVIAVTSPRPSTRLVEKTASLSEQHSWEEASDSTQKPNNVGLTIDKTEDEWRKLLTNEEFNVLRGGGTEARFSSPLLKEKRPGVFKCKACGHELFSSHCKYDSGSGWPSFFQALPGAVNETMEKEPVHDMERRTEVTCARCGGHLGHVFDDGPSPTHKRYCMNGVVLTFSPNSTT